MSLRRYIDIVQNGLLLERADTNSPEFQRWFGNSQVVDAEGNPLLCYHGTTAGGFTAFLPLSHFGTKDAAHHFVGREYGHIRPVYLRIEKPFEVEDSDLYSHEQFMEWVDTAHERGILTDAEKATIYGDPPDTAEAAGLRKHYLGTQMVFVKALRRHGHDGLVYANTMEDVGHRSWVIFSPDQVWHAILDRPDLTESAKAQPTSLADLEAFAHTIGVDLKISKFGRKTIHLEWIDRFKGGAAGSGATVMKALCDYADQKGLTIILTLWEGEPKLRAYYETFGFELVGDEDDAEPAMERMPRPRPRG